MKRLLLILLPLAIGFVTNAQEAVKALTIQECVNIALENNLRVKRGLYNLRTSQINLTQSKAVMLPTINGGGSYGKNYGRALNPVTNLFIDRNSSTVGLQGISSVTLFNGFRIQNSIKQSSTEYEATNEDLAKAKNDVILNVVTLYTSVIFNKELLANSDFQLKSSQEQLERIKKQVLAGSLPRANELNQEAQVATNEVNLINQENALNLSLLQLKQAMQVPGSTQLDVVVPVVALEDLVLDQTPEQIFGISVQTMPEVKSAVLRVQSAEYAFRAAKGNYYPRLSLSGSMQTNYSDASKLQQLLDPPTLLSTTPIGKTASNEDIFVYQQNTVPLDYSLNNQLRDNLFKGLSLQLNIPVFNNLQTRSSVQRAAVSKEVASIAKQETENALRQNIETAYNDAVAASKTYGASLKQVNAREEAYRMTKQRFEIGAANYVEFRISENDLFQAKSDLARAKYNFIFRKKLLDFYQGKTIEF
jgi:outer membrane protein